MYWPKLPSATIRERVFEALNKNLNYNTEPILGLPGTYLDQEQFYNFPFLKEAAFLSVLVNNPNHIGCHTYNDGEKYFSGTQKLEIDLLRICAVEILGAEESSYDGYVAPGGTEANIQAQWMYRNYFMQEHNANVNEIGVIFSEDAHYSVYKGSNLLGIHPIVVKVNHNTRQIELDDLKEKLEEAYEKGIRYLIIHLSMGTTIFGSVDSPGSFIELVKQYFKHYFVHVDAAFGGFIYPFSTQQNDLNFSNPEISSITIDGHKMLQSPYGTGIFLCRKSLIEYVQTKEASYVYGSDFTLCGSRSGANAISMWMILMTHGSNGWTHLIQQLIDRTNYLCDALDKMGVKYFRNPDMNIVTIDSNEISETLAEKYYLVADNYLNPQWRKVVVMAHVKKELIDNFLIDLEKERKVAASV
ncbi:glutamate/tyrosine decarboxylase-like PLP-dependent enzyme [Chryseobacterium vietnamense]|uniref:Glutamate/tyrosine decarboxylase-like PLP-dependent enzyme n=1 Tax=Chryseobacterium vietnamense TaxID=866785 RepID=A0ACC6JDC4_9FLAO|nr:pyridoxal-dependent decarboxylase [Chryseobacterium vietnamense]MDR6461091.1 glutamate/tyrosine decarboxylase-like PLP-dependent enzyme [Chryseobacterium vietnamense]MDR6489536.1 glutamate/tyrosine decarboxylase-like PLP-dependent enzyme [Chryseobacterium vietnamense]